MQEKEPIIQYIQAPQKGNKMTGSELKIFQQIGTSLEEISKLIKDANSLTVKNVNPNNKNTVESKIVDAIDKLTSAVDKSTLHETKLAESVTKIATNIEKLEVKDIRKAIADAGFEINETLLKSTEIKKNAKK